MERYTTVVVLAGLSLTVACPALAQTSDATPNAARLRPSQVDVGASVSGSANGAGAAGARAPAATTNGTSADTAATPTASASDSTDGTTEDDAAPREKGKKKKHKKATWHTSVGTFQLSGRVRFRAELQRRDRTANEPVNNVMTSVTRTVDSLDFTVPDARVMLHYTAPQPWLSAELEVDFAGKPDLKDAYVEAKNDYLSARGGQFKMPVSAIEMESPWVLPTIDRGLISEILLDRLDVAGRRPGITFAAHLPDGVKPRLTVGAFQGTVVTETASGKRKTELISAAKLDSQNLVARAEIEAVGTKFAGYFQYRIGSPNPNETRYYWTAGADAVADWVFSNGGLRLWLDGTVGASWLEIEQKRNDGVDATFVSARAMVGYRFGGTEDRAFYVEPFGMAAIIDPDMDVVSDMAWEGNLGVNVGYWQRARLSLQGQIHQAQRNFPDTYFPGQHVDRYRLLAQAGVSF